MLDLEVPAPFYPDLAGLPLQNGVAYYGVSGQNPVTAPTTVYWDAAGTQPAAQPVRIMNGSPVRNGAPARVWVAGDYSLLVLDKAGRQVLYQPSQPASLRFDLAGAGGSALVSFMPAGPNAVLWDLQSKSRERISILDDMTPQQRADARSGALALDLTVPIQNALTYLAGVGGGVLEWYDAKVTGVLVYQGSNLKIVPRGGNNIVQAGASFNTLRIYPNSLNSIWDGTGRPAGFETGIDGAPELLMYEADDTKRLRNIQIHDLNFTYTGGGSGRGRFIDAFSVDQMSVRGCKAASASNAMTLWYCRNAEVMHNDLASSIPGSFFPLFLFKSYGEVAHNIFRDGFIGVETKGCYPQAGKTVYQAFDAGYEFFNPVKLHDNKFYNIASCAWQCGYFDNSTADISSGAPVGVTKSQWYGEVWGYDAHDNTVYFAGNPGIQSGGARMNVNTRYAKYHHNTFYGGGLVTFGARDSEFTDNTLINPRITATSAIELAGFALGAAPRNSQRILVARNRVSGHLRGAIYLRGCDNCDALENNISGGAAGFVQIDVDSSNSVTTSTGNNVLRNRIIYAAADFAHPIRSQNAAFTVIDQNRGYGGWYSGNALDSDGFADLHYKRGVVRADTPYVQVGVPGSCYVGQNFGDQNAIVPEAGYAIEMAINGMVSAGWRQPIREGQYFRWYDATDRVRIKAVAAGKPTGDTDGTVVGTQV